MLKPRDEAPSVNNGPGTGGMGFEQLLWFNSVNQDGADGVSSESGKAGPDACFRYNRKKSIGP